MGQSPSWRANSRETSQISSLFVEPGPPVAVYARAHLWSKWKPFETKPRSHILFYFIISDILLLHAEVSQLVSFLKDFWQHFYSHLSPFCFLNPAHFKALDFIALIIVEIICFIYKYSYISVLLTFMLLYPASLPLAIFTWIWCGKFFSLLFSDEVEKVWNKIGIRSHEN